MDLTSVWMTAALLLLLESVRGYNILVLMPFASKSHYIAFEPIAEELAKRGHNVTIASPFKASDERRPGIQNVHLKLAENVFDAHQFSFFDGDFTNPRVRQNFMDMGKGLVKATYEEEFIKDLVRNPRIESKSIGTAAAGDVSRPKHDVVVVDAIFNDFTLPLAHHMGVPSVYYSPGSLAQFVLSSMNIPFPLSYVPLMTTYVTKGPMNFFQRAQNVFEKLMFEVVRSRLMQPRSEEEIVKHLPKSPPLSVLERNVSFLLYNTKIPLTRSAPTTPYMAEVGGVHCRPAKTLPKDLEEFMQSAGKEGVIFFSLGHFTKGKSMPPEMRDKALKVFSKLPQKILWKYEQDIENLPPNIKLVKWAPQQDILGHSQTRLFITHGGGMSVQESAFHACPMLAFPLSADQLGNVATVVDAGIAEYLDWKTFTADELFNKIKLILMDKGYKENGAKVSAIFRDSIVEPAVTASYWIEYVIRHGGAHHLKCQSEHLNFFQYFLLDLVAAIALVLLLLLLVSIYVLKKLVGLFRGRKSSAAAAKKSKQKKS